MNNALKYYIVQKLIAVALHHPGFGGTWDAALMLCPLTCTTFPPHLTPHHFRPEAGVLGRAAASSPAPSHPCPGASGGPSYSKSNPAASAHRLLCQLPHWNPLPPWLWQSSPTSQCQHVPPALPLFLPLHQPQFSLARLSFSRAPISPLC